MMHAIKSESLLHKMSVLDKYPFTFSCGKGVMGSDALKK